MEGPVNLGEGRAFALMSQGSADQAKLREGTATAVPESQRKKPRKMNIVEDIHLPHDFATVEPTTTMGTIR